MTNASCLLLLIVLLEAQTIDVLVGVYVYVCACVCMHVCVYMIVQSVYMPNSVCAHNVWHSVALEKIKPSW